MTETPDTPTEQLAEARMWARHGYELGQRSCTWADHGVAPAWLTEGWPIHFPGPADCVHTEDHVGECPCSSKCGCCTVTAAAPAPAELREQYAAAIYEQNNPGMRWADAHPDDRLAYAADADAVLNVRDTELQQLRERLAEARTALRIAEGDRDAAVERAEEGQAALEMYGLWQRRAESARREIEQVRAIPRLPHSSQQTGELGRAYTRGWESVINAIDTAVGRPQEHLTRAESHAAAVEQIRTAAGGLYATTGLRVLDALDPQEQP